MTEILAFSKALAAGLDKLWKGQEETCQLLIDLITKVNLQHNMEQDNITDLVQVKVAHIYFDITKVAQGPGPTLAWWIGGFPCGLLAVVFCWTTQREVAVLFHVCMNIEVMTFGMLGCFLVTVDEQTIVTQALCRRG